MDNTCTGADELKGRGTDPARREREDTNSKQCGEINKARKFRERKRERGRERDGEGEAE